MKSDNVLPFKRVLKPALATETAPTELKELLSIHERLIALLRETGDEGLDYLTDGMIDLVVRCREALATGVGDITSQALRNEMKDVLRQIPASLRSLLPGIGPRLSESIEHKLGIRFSSF